MKNDTHLLHTVLFFLPFKQLIDAVDGNYMIVRGVPTEVLNLSSFDFLGFSQDETVRVTARSALEKYGCGSCGPRGFYGTIDQHLMIEEAMAVFMGTEEAISYSDGAATVSSTIPAFVKTTVPLVTVEPTVIAPENDGALAPVVPAVVTV